MLPWIPFALAEVPSAEAPSADALLQLAQVHCRAEDGTTWTRTADARRWVVAREGQTAFQAHASIALSRRVVEPATRLAREGAPWQWTERISVRTTTGEPLPFGAADVDARFRCTDTSDPASAWVDVDGWFAAPLPGAGVHRCRSSDGSVAWRTWSRMAGIPPRPGDRLGGTTLVVDGLKVDEHVRVEPTDLQRPVRPRPDIVVAEVASTSPLRSADPLHIRTRQVITFVRADSSPVLPDKPTLKATLTCDSYRYPPMP